MRNIGKKTLTMIICMCTLLIATMPANIHASEKQQTKMETKKNVKNQKINIYKKKIVIKKRKTAMVRFQVTGCSKKNVVWTSSNPKVVRVNRKTGKIRGKSGGKVTITATIKGTNISDSITVVCKNYYMMRVKTTGYCNRRCCAGAWAGHNTASGRRPRANHTIAVDRRVIPLGTRVMIDKRIYVAEDTGVRGRVIDIYYNSHRAASRHGVKYKTVKVYY